MNIKKVLPIVIIGMFLFLATYGQVVMADETITKAENYYEGREYYADDDVNQVFDPSNPNPAGLNFMQWKYDFAKERKELPKGVYVGNHLTPSVMELDYKPVWEPETEGGTASFRSDPTYGSGRKIVTESRGSYGLTVLHIRKTFSASEIMNGASEFWVKLPIYPQQLETLDLNTLYEIEGSKDSWFYERHLKIHSGLYMFDGSYTNFTIKDGETAGIFDLRTKDNIKSKANAIISEDDKYNNSIYQKMNVILESDKIYTFALVLITEEKPYMKIDEVISNDDNLYMSTIDIINITDTTLIGVGGSGFSVTLQEAVPEGLTANISVIDKKMEKFGLLPHFSFVFTKGVGQNNLFGHSIEETSDVEQSIHYDMIAQDVNHTYPSFYTPFIYQKGLDTDLKPSIKVILANSNGKALKMANGEVDEIFFTDDAFQYGSYYIWNVSDYNYSFRDYFLFSGYILEWVMYASNYTGDTYNSLEYKGIPENLTFLCKEDTDNIYRTGSLSDISLQNDRAFWFGTDWYRKDTQFDSNVQRINSSDGIVEYHNYTNIPERYFYKIHTSLKFTDGRWNTIKQPPITKILSWEEMERRGLSNNTIIKGRHRNYKIIGQNFSSEVNLEEGGSAEGGLSSYMPDNILGNPLKAVMGFGRWLLDKFVSTMRNMVDYLYRGIKSIYGFITSIPENVWNGLQKLGKWIKRTVIDFFAPVLEVLGDLWELGGLYLEALSYVLSMIVFFVGMAVVVKILSYTELRILSERRGA